MNGKGGAGLAAGAGCLFMAILGPLLLVVMAMSGIPAPDKTTTDDGALNEAAVPAAYRAAVRDAGTRCSEVSAPLIAAQIEAESNWNPNAESPAGAQGLAQFMPGTWAEWGKDYSGDGKADPFDPIDAIGSQADLMCSLSATMKEKLGTGVVKGYLLDLSLASYNAGAGNVIKYGGVPRFEETEKYVAKIKELIPKYSTDSAGSSDIVAQAKTWLGYPYVWGGGGVAGPSGIGPDGRGPGFDCSGLVQYAIFHATGISLPRTADDEIRSTIGTTISRDWSLMQPGDIIAFSDSGGFNYQHIAIYVGNGQIIHAPTPGKNVQIDKLKGNSYYEPMVWKIKRFTS